MNPERKLRDFALTTPSGFLATGLASGLSPKAPGTVGTLVAVPLALMLKTLPPVHYGIALVAAFLLGLWLCRAAERALGEADHGAVVWDEFVGYWVAVALVPPSALWLFLAFVLFRILDIWKPWPIGWLDHHLKGGMGVMMDDLVAGLITLGLLAGLERLIS